MKCKTCDKEIGEKLKYLAYYAEGKPVYWKKCDACMKARYLEFKVKYLNQRE